jgi:hypothetical protein
VDFGVLLRPLRFGARLRVPHFRSLGGRSGALFAAFAAVVIWTVKLTVLAFALAVVVVAYACLGVAWLLAPVAAVVAPWVYRGPFRPSTHGFRDLVVRAVGRLNAAVRRHLGP